LSGGAWIVRAGTRALIVLVVVREGREAVVEAPKAVKVQLRVVVEVLLGLGEVGRIRVSRICTDRSHRLPVTVVQVLRGENWVEGVRKREVVEEVQMESICRMHYGLLALLATALSHLWRAVEVR